MDVYERPWMAPRAGFEVDSKYMMREGLYSRTERRTPNGTPDCTELRMLPRVLVIDSGSGEASSDEVVNAPEDEEARADDHVDDRAPWHWHADGQ